mmetsp:Transcript_31442/g.94056  ORF Transcript_31442/g.94056 Transcript_31442/m.94056 type:complete len:405 (-) Transcript_31442:518-1732(-)
MRASMMRSFDQRRPWPPPQPPPRKKKKTLATKTTSPPPGRRRRHHQRRRDRNGRPDSAPPPVSGILGSCPIGAASPCGSCAPTGTWRRRTLTPTALLPPSEDREAGRRIGAGGDGAVVVDAEVLSLPLMSSRAAAAARRRPAANPSPPQRARRPAGAAGGPPTVCALDPENEGAATAMMMLEGCLLAVPVAAARLAAARRRGLASCCRAAAGRCWPTDCCSSSSSSLSEEEILLSWQMQQMRWALMKRLRRLRQHSPSSKIDWGQGRFSCAFLRETARCLRHEALAATLGAESCLPSPLFVLFRAILLIFCVLLLFLLLDLVRLRPPLCHLLLLLRCRSAHPRRSARRRHSCCRSGFDLCGPLLGSLEKYWRERARARWRRRLPAFAATTAGQRTLLPLSQGRR